MPLNNENNNDNRRLKNHVNDQALKILGKSNKKIVTHILNSRSEILDYLIDIEEPHIVSYTGTTSTIRTRTDKYIITDNALSYKSLGFIRSVNADCEKIMENKYIDTDISYDAILYSKYINVQAGFFNDVSQLDLNKAYWVVAYKMGFISKKIYEKGLTMDKKSRLIAFGSLATVKRMYVYDPEIDDYNFLNQFYSKKLRAVFFKVALEVSKMMLECVKEVGSENFFLYWVDAFFFKNNEGVKNGVVNFFKKRGLDLKTVEVSSITIKNINEIGKKQIFVIEKKEEKENLSEIKIKPFSFFYKNKEGEIIENYKRSYLNFLND